MVLFRRRSTSSFSPSSPKAGGGGGDGRDDSDDMDNTTGTSEFNISSSSSSRDCNNHAISSPKMFRRRTTSSLASSRRSSSRISSNNSSSSSSNNNNTDKKLITDSPPTSNPHSHPLHSLHHLEHDRGIPVWSRLLRSCTIANSVAVASPSSPSRRFRAAASASAGARSRFQAPASFPSSSSSPFVINPMLIPNTMIKSLHQQQQTQTLHMSTSTATTTTATTTTTTSRTSKRVSSSNSITSTGSQEDSPPLLLGIGTTTQSVSVPLEVQILQSPVVTLSTSPPALQQQQQQDQENDEAYWEALQGQEEYLNPLDQLETTKMDPKKLSSRHYLYFTAVSLAETDQYEQALALTERGILECHSKTNHGETEDGDNNSSNDGDNNDNDDLDHPPPEEEEQDLLVELQVLKAQILGRMGRYRESLTCYQDLLQLLDTTTATTTTNSSSITLADRASILYTCGRLCSCLEDHRGAVDYYQQELRATLPLLELNNKNGIHGLDNNSSNNIHSNSGAGVIRASIARIYHEIAHVYKDGLGELSKALRYLQLAHETEMSILHHIQHESRVACAHCSVTATSAAAAAARKNSMIRKSSSSFSATTTSRTTGTASSSSNTVTTVVTRCPLHRVAIQQAYEQIRETKLGMGRIHYELGDLDQAIRLTLQ